MVNLNLLQVLFDKTKGRVKYKLGAKASPTADSDLIKRIDCSGFVRWILARASEQRLILPDGSQNQLGWSRANLRKLDKYSDVTYAEGDPSRLFIAFLSPKPGAAWPRHVWLLRSNGVKMRTMESHGSGGVNSREWDTSALKACKEVFEIKLA